MLIYIDRNPEVFGAGKTLIGDEDLNISIICKHPKKKKICKRYYKFIFYFIIVNDLNLVYQKIKISFKS